MTFTVVVFQRGLRGDATPDKSIDICDRKVCWWRISVRICRDSIATKMYQQTVQVQMKKKDALGRLSI